MTEQHGPEAEPWIVRARLEAEKESSDTAIKWGNAHEGLEDVSRADSGRASRKDWGNACVCGSDGESPDAKTRDSLEGGAGYGDHY